MCDFVGAPGAHALIYLPLFVFVGVTVWILEVVDFGLVESS